MARPLWILVAALWGLGCGAGSAAPDGSVIDGSDEAGVDVDAGADAGIDANAWTCDPHPSPLPAPTSTVANVVFDTPVPPPRYFGGSVEVFDVDDSFVLVGESQLDVIDGQGSLVRTLPLTLPDSTGIYVTDLARGPAGLGAVVGVDTDTSRTDFCLLDVETGLDASHCTALMPTTDVMAHVVSLGADGYAVYAARNADVVRWRFDPAGVLQDEVTLWTDELTSRFVLEAGEGPAGTVIVTTSAQCEVYAHHWTPEAHDVTVVRPAELTYSGLSLLSEWSGDSSATRTWAKHMNCGGSGTGCEATSARPMTVLTKFDLGTGAVDVRPIALPLASEAAVIPDGDDTAIIYIWSLYDVRLSIFNHDGDAIVSEVKLPLSYEETGIEVQFVGAGRAVGPRDYVFVYAGTGDSGPDRRIARVQMP